LGFVLNPTYGETIALQGFQSIYQSILFRLTLVGMMGMMPWPRGGKN